MKIDVEFYGQVNIDEALARSQGLDIAFKDALNKLNISLDGYLYVNDSDYNNDICDELDDDTLRSEYFFPTDNLLILRKNDAPNKYLKHALETVDD